MKKISLLLVVVILCMMIYRMIHLGESSRDLDIELGKVKHVEGFSQENLSQVKKINSLEGVSFKMSKIENLNINVKQIVGETQTSWSQRNEIARKLKSEGLNSEDYEALYSFIASYPNEEDLKWQKSYHSIKTFVLNFLFERDKKHDDSRMGEFVAKVITDKKQHRVMRNYMIQGMEQYYERRWPRKNGEEVHRLNDQEKEERSILEQSLLLASQHNKGALGGTALFVLNNINKTYGISNPKYLEEISSTVLWESDCDNSSKMGALDVLAQVGDEKAKQKIKNLVFNEEVNTNLRMMAIAKSSQMGADSKLITYLEEEILDSHKKADKRLVMAAQAAMTRMNQKGN